MAQAAIVDVISTSGLNLYAELLRFLDCADPAIREEPPPMYAVTLRLRSHGRQRLLDNGYHPLTIGQSLPTLPVWLNSSLAIPLNLESTYEETCRSLRIR